MLKSKAITIIFLLLTAASLAASRFVSPADAVATSGVVVGQVGATYLIVERDAMSELMEKVRHVDWKRWMSGLRHDVETYRPSDLPEEKLPRARHEAAFMVDPTYTLPFDIPDGKGGILYPKGFTFNPLDYVSLPGAIVFIDGSDKKQVSWFKKSPYARSGAVMLLLTGGNYMKVERELGRPVFYADDQIVKRFDITALPAVIFQRGKLLEVTEIKIEIKDKSGKNENAK